MAKFGALFSVALAKERWHPAWCRTRMEHINYHFRDGGDHKFAFDYETLHQVLSDCGFAAIRRVSFNSSIDSDRRRVGTLYVEARRPAVPERASLIREGAHGA
ncbi:hypothetical protein RA210_U380003 [Rubrivivax sp. A210]|nr:hypothetical protein RA210_U380003 [Rubrivivax sp. A210]